MHKLNQRGFSAVEALLSLILVVLIVFVGYYVYHAQKTTSNTYNSASKVAQSSPPKTTSTQKYFTIKEWNVRAPYSGKLTLEYTLANSDSDQYAGFSSAQLNANDSQCKTEGDYGGVISRLSPTEEWLNEDGSDSGQTVAQYAATLPKDQYAQVNSYDYFYTHPNGVCGTSPSTQDLMTQTDSAVQSLVSHLQAVPAQ